MFSYFQDYYTFYTFTQSLLIWWFILLIFQRVSNRYPKVNPWKKDLTITFLQSIMVVTLIPILSYFLK